MYTTMVTENNEYGPEDAFSDFSEYVEEELGEDVPFEDQTDGICSFQNYEKMAVNAGTHFQNQINELSYLQDRAETLRDLEDEQLNSFAAEVDRAVEEHLPSYREVSDELYENGEFDDENILRMSTPAHLIDGEVVPEVETFIEEVYQASSEAREDVEVLKKQYGELADSVFSELDGLTHDVDQDKTLKTEEPEEDIEALERISNNYEKLASKMREKTTELREKV